MEFPTIYTNIWDVLLAVPFIIILTQFIKMLLNLQKQFVPLIALAIGLLISIFISHHHSILSGLFMGWFYGYAAIGSYAALKTAILSFRKKRN
ncbi:hypothetical protein ACE38V_10580 [Cytobacillus sp. Hz8]|uniref:hypothetical protein n=1 Tax=Cytobacillus sp. Hz8 TaxID=3347168 RepID=UPI0035DE8B61